MANFQFSPKFNYSDKILAHPQGEILLLSRAPGVHLFVFFIFLSLPGLVRADTEYDEFQITNVNRKTYEIHMQGNPNRLRLGEWLVSVLPGGKTCFLKVNMIKKNRIMGGAKTCRYKDSLRKGMTARYYVEPEAVMKPVAKVIKKPAKKRKRKRKKKRRRKRKKHWREKIGISAYRNFAAEVELEGSNKSGGASFDGEDSTEGVFGFGVEYHDFKIWKKLVGFGAGVNYELKRDIGSRTLRFIDGSNNTNTIYSSPNPSFSLIIAFLEVNFATRNGKFYGNLGANWNKPQVKNFAAGETADGGVGYQLGVGFKGFSRRSFLKKLNIEVSYRKYAGKRENSTQNMDSASLVGFQLRLIYHPMAR